MTTELNTKKIESKPHYPILDGLRGVAAILVVAFHILEAGTGNSLTQWLNHGYLAVDFFFVLSGFVIGYAYDDRWKKMTIGTFFRRRLERLHPMVIMGMIIGALCYYFQDSAAFPIIHTVPVGKMLLVMLIGFTLLPVPTSLDIRGWGEFHPLDGPGWSLLFEYVANIFYALGVRKFPKWALIILVTLSGAALLHMLLTNHSGDVIGGWSLEPAQLRIGFTRLIYPFFAGLLLSRIMQPGKIKNAFLWCSLLIVISFGFPRLGGDAHRWMNGLYEGLTIILLFPFIVYLGASGTMNGKPEQKVCKFLGDISYPIYITHYPFVYIYTGWVSDHRNLDAISMAPYAIATFLSAVFVGYLSLKFWDEPIRKWLKNRSGNKISNVRN